MSITSIESGLTKLSHCPVNGSTLLTPPTVARKSRVREP